MDSASNPPGIAFSPSRILLAGAVALCTLGALIYFVFDPTKVAIFPTCIFHQVTGWDCPGCGAQRSLHELLHGHFVAALRLNAMFVLSLPLAAWYGPRLVRRTFTHQPSGAVPTWLWFFIAAWIIFGIARNFPFPVCAWFKA